VVAPHTAAMPITPGQKVPSIKIRQATPDGRLDVDPAQLFAGKKVVMFSLPGAFTSTCSTKHLPGYLARYDELRAKGVDLIACLSVNDAAVMQAWGKEQGVGNKIAMLADGAAAFTRALGIEYEDPFMGVRARRGVFVFDNGVLTSIELEAPGAYDVSSAESCSIRLR
jgi:peroxiredoxin